jgi:hypothetical protein
MSNFVCRSCGARIVWTVTERGRRMPIDPVPNPAGNIILRERAAGLEPVAVYTSAPPAEGEKRFTSHFATCPQAKKWRKKNGKKTTTTERPTE